MAKGEGFVRQLDQPFWRIDDLGGNRLCRYSPVEFPGFVDGDPVFFIDDSLPDGVADNVQPRALVDELTAVATPRNGATDAAALLLHAKVMHDLLVNTQALADGQPSTIPDIVPSLATIASALNITSSARATVPKLRKFGF